MGSAVNSFRKLSEVLMRSRDNLIAFAVLSVANLFIYHDYWLGRKIITSKDFLALLYPLLNFQSDCLHELSWPLWNPFMNFGYPYVEHYVNSSLLPTHLLMGVFTGAGLTLIHWELLSWVIVGGFGMYLCVREFGHSYATALICGVSFMFCGQMLTLPQWSHLVCSAASFPYLILGYHRAVKTNNPFSLVSIGLLAMSVAGGYLPTIVYGIYILIAYVLIDSFLRKDFRPGIKYLAFTFIAAFLLALPKIVPLYNAIQAGPRISTYSPTPDPYNVINFYNFMSYLLPVKFYFSLYVGELFVIAFCYGIMRKMITVNALLILAILTGWLFMVDHEGNVSLLRSLSFVLPFMKTARNEWINWYYPSIFIILYLARYVDAFLSEGTRKASLIAAAAFIVLLSAVFASDYSIPLHYQAYLVHAVLALAWLGVAFMHGRKNAQAVLAIVLVAAEFFLVFNRVSVDETPSRKGPLVEARITHQVNVSQSYLDDELVKSPFTARFTDDRYRPSIGESRKSPFLISGLGGAPSYNMFPEQYSLFIDAMNFKYFSGWWYNTQERFEFIRLKDSPQLAQMDKLPLFAFFDGRTGTPNSSAASLNRITCSSFSFTTDAGEPGFLLLNQMFDDRWKVTVDGRERELMRGNDYFMSVDVEAGRHTIQFDFTDKVFTAALCVSFASLIGLLVLYFRKSSFGRSA